MSDSIIHIENLGKQYVIGGNSADSLREQLTHSLKSVFRRNTQKRTPHSFWALKDINLDVKQGEVLGIVGHNGAGKSTLLKILSRITHPTVGKITIHGRTASLLEVGTGFHPELTGRENIFMNAAVLGMKRAETKRRFDEIVDFAEVEQFIDTPVKRYSSGMYMRLAFAVAAHLEPEILIVDEVLAVGDLAFQKKSLGKMSDVASHGRTVLFVSHNMLAVRSLCTRAIWLKSGNIEMNGDTQHVVDSYTGVDSQRIITSLTFPDELDRRMQIKRAFIKRDQADNIFADNEELILGFDYIVRETIEDVLLAVDVRTSGDVSLYYANDDSLLDSRKRAVGLHRVELKIPVHLFAPGDYSIAFGFWQPGHESEHFPVERLTFQRQGEVTRLSSHGIAWPSLLYIPSDWTYSDNPE